MRVRRISALIAIASITAAACGSGTSEPAAAPAAAQVPNDDDADDAADDQVDPPVDAPAAAEPAPAEGNNDTGDEPSPDTDQESPPASDDQTVVPPSEPAEPPADEPAAVTLPDDGCSPDNSPTPTDASEGAAPVVEVRAESVNSPLPDLPVRRINCNGGWVNLRNELPSAQPLLVWFWAPH